MCSDESDWTCLQPGFPIRKSSDHSLVIDSPRLIADSYVLLRFLVPRHPPCALKNLSHKDARVHCVVLKKRAAPHQTLRLPPATHPDGQANPGGGSTESGGPSQPVTGPKVKLAPEPSGPNNVPGATTHQPAFHCPPPKRRACTYDTGACQRQLIDVPPLSTRCRTLAGSFGLWIACATSAP
jgi:hypothetical protein